MSQLLSLHEVSKKIGIQSLFCDLSFSIYPKDRIGIIGPNGSGKSTLLKIIADLDDVDDGKIIRMRGLSVSYVSQVVAYDSDESIRSLIVSECSLENNVTDSAKAISILDQLGFHELEKPFSYLSGGQKKKVQLAIKLAAETDLLLLDEPSNHLDFSSIKRLESLLDIHPAPSMMISHDRYLLKCYARRMIEVNSRYKNGYFSFDGSYLDFIKERSLLIESDNNEYESLKNTVRNEQAWLRKGAKARSAKSKHRTEVANSLIESLNLSKARRQISESRIEFNSSSRKTKRLLELEQVNKIFNDKYIFRNINLSILSGSKIALIGPNGTGKTTILKILNGDIKCDSGNIKRANNLKITYFSQLAEYVDPETTLSRVLAPEGDSVIYHGSLVHVASYASRFQFDARMLAQPFGSLSGGERAKSRIARLMLEKPDILLLDEPTNDLDIPTLEILEQSLIDFTGALVLVSHDRWLLENVCSQFIALDEKGGFNSYASFEQAIIQLENDQDQDVGINHITKKELNSALQKSLKTEKNTSDGEKKKLTYKEQFEYDSMEASILEAEEEMARHEFLIATKKGGDMSEEYESLAKAQARVEELYARWAELEKRVRQS
ncbi:MAG TPA: ABC-F family ATP-binding cassette domain-containing protein [Oligoflexia bacterium]|nr:ABC-F family ATP-binding cassette domain-containing protein [Oligoflexia bacterium]HMP47288.1 ABC-F family ATP-binding cassette domain-containing protein [Oligoflexia bacterium]